MGIFSNILKPRPRRYRPLWVVDLKEDVCTRLPDDLNYSICIEREKWAPGKVYVPIGAKLVAADSEAEAREKVKLLMQEC